MFQSQAAKAFKYAATNPVKLITLLEKDPSVINCKDGEDRTLLHVACDSVGNIALVDILLSKGADVNAVDRSCHTPLYYAVKRNWTNIVARLLETNASLEVKDGTGQTLYHVAASQPENCAQILELLASKCVLDTNAVEVSGGKTAFLCALQSENKNAAMFFVDCGADLCIEDASQRNYKHYHPERLGLDQYIAARTKGSPRINRQTTNQGDSTRQAIKSTKTRIDDEFGFRMEESRGAGLPVAVNPMAQSKKAKTFDYDSIMEKRLERSSDNVTLPAFEDRPPPGVLSFRRKSFLPLQQGSDRKKSVQVSATPSETDCSISGLGAWCMLRW